jgi:exopolyphosphatase/guanosine-5'-triphosphate,3'-diphosphate pyrophosphatase
MKRLGVIDVGSNSVRALAVGCIEGRFVYLASGAWISRLAQGVGEGRYAISDEALSRTKAAVAKARTLLDANCVSLEDRSFIATESLRSAYNASFVAVELEGVAGLPLSVLSGYEEASLSFRGAAFGLRERVGLFFDLGGGSLEVGDGKRFFSLPLGAVRMASLYGEDVKKIGCAAAKGLAEVRCLFAGGAVVGVGGTSSTVAMMLKAIPIGEYHPGRVHGSLVKKGDIEGLLAKTARLSAEERRNVIGLEPGRADIIIPGMAVIVSLLDVLAIDSYTHSECDLLWGELVEMADKRGLAASGIDWRVDCVEGQV